MGHGQERVQHIGADDDHVKHGRGLDRIHHRPPEAGQIDAARGKTQDDDQPGADGRGLDRGEGAGIDAADGNHDHADQRHRLAQPGQFFAQRHLRAARTCRRIQRRNDGDGGNEQHHQQKAGQDAGHEQAADGLLGQDGIDDKAGRGRDQKAKRAPRRHRAGGQRVAVTQPLHFRQGDLADGDGSRHRRPRDRRKQRAADHRGRGKPAPKASDPCECRVIKAARKPRLRGHVAQQDEHRHDDQRIVRDRAIAFGQQDRARRAAAFKEIKPAIADRQHRECDRGAQHHEAEQERNPDQPDNRGGHCGPSRRIWISCAASTSTLSAMPAAIIA